jgi:prolyl-tRNA synthetase
MTHSDDDGLVLPPRLAPVHCVILPIYRNDDERRVVLEFAERVKREISAVQYDGRPVQVKIDDRDLRGGEKTWQHIKRGVPLRLEIGPRDVQGDSVFVGRRDRTPKEKAGVARAEFVATVAQTLAEMQQALFDRAVAFRNEHTRTIDDLGEFKSYFTPKNVDQPEIHGGIAMCHFHDGPDLKAVLDELKVTIRCIPTDAPEEPGKCIVTGQPSTRRAAFAKAY